MQNKILTARNIKYSVLAVFIITTFILLFQRAPFWDEAHAWMISKSFNLFDLIFHIEKYDGHLFIWHTVLMPFAKFDFFYPYPMYILNWIFCVFALVVFWNKAPFSVLEKSLITFSYPFVWYFGIVARCYSIGILFLFLILSFWKERLKRPYLISLLIILLANTSAMALVGAFSLGLIFLFDLIKERDYKKIVYSMLILGFGAISVFVQLWGANYPDMASKKTVFQDILTSFFFLYDFEADKNIFYITNKISAVLIFLLCFLSPLYFIKTKRALFFIISSFLSMSCIFIFKYPGSFWHYLFFFVYFISAIWLSRDENKKNNPSIKKAFNLIFVLMLFTYLVLTFAFPHIPKELPYKSKAYIIADKIKKNVPITKDNKVYLLDSYKETSVGILPYFKDIVFYDTNGDVKYSVDGFKNYLKLPDYPKDIDVFINSLSENKTNIGISEDIRPERYKGKNYDVIMEKLYSGHKPDFRIYKMIKVKNGEG